MADKPPEELIRAAKVLIGWWVIAVAVLAWSAQFGGWRGPVCVVGAVLVTVGTGHEASNRVAAYLHKTQEAEEEPHGG